MTLSKVSAKQALDLRDEVEVTIEEAVRETMQAFLADIENATLSGLAASPYTSMTASSPAPLPGGEVPSLGTMAGRWAVGVDAGTLTAVSAAFERVWRRYSDLGIVMNSPAERAMLAYVASVRDRLVRGTYFGVTVYDESFEAVRRSLAQATAEGWSRPELAQRIAAELAWETDGPHWRNTLANVDSQIDGILDPLGEPGNPAREYARLNDPRVKALREQRNLAIRHLDAEKSIWQARANLIARTEATGTANYGAQQALAAEGAERKMWVSTSGARTRLTHSLASGQVVRLGQPFTVGGAAMQYPGDPNGPVEEVANCRCAMVSPDNL